jgi:hypothetical protein
MITLAIILLILGFQQEQKDLEHLQNIKNSNEKISNYMFDSYIPKQIKEGLELSNEVKSDILKVFNKNYPNKEILKKELTDAISARIDNSFAMSLIGDSVEGKTLNGITGDKADNNDIIITIRNPETSDYVISVDLSLNCASEDRVRIEEVEKKNQFAKKLFSNAFTDYTKRGREVTFWSFLEPTKYSPWYDDVKNMESTDLQDLKEYFIKYDCNLDSLRSFELLVSTRIYDKEDYFGTPVINGGTFTNQDMTIIITSGQNLLDQLELDNNDRIILKQMEDSKNSELEKYTLYKLQSQIFMFIVSLVFILLFLYVSDHKIKK